MLNLSGCSRIVELPAEIAMCKALSELDLSGCERLLRLPDELVECSALAICCKSIMQEPDQFAKAEHLIKTLASRNQFQLTSDIQNAISCVIPRLPSSHRCALEPCPIDG